MSKKSTKKTLAIVLAMLLVCVVSVTGTLAYLQAQTEAVTNTFAVGKLFDNPTTDFVLKEHQATHSGDGLYELGTGTAAEVGTNTYENILPGVDLPKDPFVRITDLKEDAYLFIKVSSNLPETLEAKIDSHWKKVKDITGENGGTVYVYKVGDNDYTLEGKGTGVGPVNYDPIFILEDNKVLVHDNYAGGSSAELKFYGYIIQAAGFVDDVEADGLKAYEKAWNAITANN